ncbi:XkdF-like putative serine protease domain-containing protein [Sphingobacterium mizutaii]|uniref:XkdF-like putative serine protease domain-containing protein n=1 Tax=Sphingobacterium mizutaii TaxID=1010 RepID=UPI001626BFC0|nr:XkdF-like putative serine protease domain-containing protein [Sphingobacterium mizutaii]
MDDKIYELLIDPSKGFEVDKISIVDFPAVESNFLKFNNQSTKQSFSVNDEKMELLGVAMTPDKLIDRLDSNGNYFKVWFSKETIRQIAQHFFKSGYQHQINLQHTDTMIDAYVYQSYIVDYDKGIFPPKGVGEVNDGTWIVGMKIENNEVGKKVWDAVKKEIFNGFSIEGYFIDTLTKNFNHKDQYNHLLEELNAELDAFITKYNIK